METFEQHYWDQLHAIELNGATFYVRLPTADNVRYQRALSAEALDIDYETGEHKRKELTPTQMVELQIATVVRTCIRKVEGWPGYSTEKLLSMPDACEDLWSAVFDLCRKVEGEAEAAVKKSAPMSTGQSDGPDSESSTKPLKKAAG